MDEQPVEEPSSFRPLDWYETGQLMEELARRHPCAVILLKQEVGDRAAHHILAKGDRDAVIGMAMAFVVARSTHGIEFSDDPPDHMNH